MSAEGTEHRHAVEGPSQSDELFHEIFSRAAVGIAQIGLSGEWLHVNSRYCEMLGYSEAELRTKTLEELTHPDDRDADLAARQQLLASDISSHIVEKRCIRKDGKILWGRLHRSLVRDSGNRPKYFVTVIEDVTDKIEAERELQETEQRLTLAQDAAQLGTWDRDLRTEAVTISGKCAQLHGLPPDRNAVTREEWSNLIHPDDRKRVQALVREAPRTRIFDTEFRVLWPDGSIHWLRGKGTVLVDGSDRPVRSVGVVEDVTQRKQIEAALRESEERFRHMADTAPVMIWVSGPDKGATFFNKCCLDFTGHRMEEKLGEGWTAALHPEDREQFLGIYSSSIDARKEFRSIFRLRRADGEYRWVLCTGVPRFAPGGVFSGFIGSCIDVTDQKLTEERLQASEAGLIDAQRLAKIVSWQRNIESDRLRWSDDVFRIFGVPNEALSSLPAFLASVHPKDREKVLEVDSRVRSYSAPVEVEYRIIRPDGEVRYLRSIVEAVRNHLGIAVRIAGASQDITEQVEARELLRRSEQDLKNAERLAHVGYWHWDLRTNGISWSEEMFRIIGKPRDYTPTQEGFSETVVPEDREPVQRAIRKSLENKSGNTVEYQITGPNGDLRKVSCTWEVLLDEEGLPARLFGACQDVTDLRRSQEESFSRQKLESVGVLASGIAHDFNNVLGGILGQAELIESDLAEGLSPLDGIARIKSVAIRGAEIVRQLMIYAGQDQPAAAGSVDMSRLVEEMLRLLNVTVSKRVVLETNLDRNLPPVRGSAPQIQQVVMNLVINASEAIGEMQGLIRVATSRLQLGERPRFNEAVNLPPGEYVLLEVSDTGCGMTEEAKAKIFDPFYTTKFLGRGLGLAVVQGIVRDHGGAIRVISAPGQGAKFQVLLPCGSEPVSPTETIVNSRAAKSNINSGTILVIEDEDLLRLAVSRALRKRGLSVLEAGDGTAAMELLHQRANDLDVVLLDVTLPGVSSRELFEEAHRLRPQLKVILTSAYGRETINASFAGLNVDRFIRKPFRLAELVPLLENALSS